MSTKNKRFMLTVPGDIESEVKEIKKELFTMLHIQSYIGSSSERALR